MNITKIQAPRECISMMSGHESEIEVMCWCGRASQSLCLQVDLKMNCPCGKTKQSSCFTVTPHSPTVPLQ